MATTKATKANSKATKTAPQPNGKLTARQYNTLAALQAGGAQNRRQLATATGQQKGWAALLGAPSKGAPAPGTLQALGYVTVSASLPYVYTLTANGAAALASTPAPVAKPVAVDKAPKASTPATKAKD